MKQFWVPGKVAGQGAIRHNAKGFGYHANSDALKVWRNSVAWHARAARVELVGRDSKNNPLPVLLEARFILEKPKSVTREFPTVAPDLDHYIRAIGAALKGLAYLDDSQITDWVTSKRYGDTPGVMISVGLLTSA